MVKKKRHCPKSLKSKLIKHCLQADQLETVSITNWPNEMVAGGMAFDDSWIPALLEANPLPGLRELTLRMDSDHYVEEGFLTRTSLQTLLTHATTHCPRLEKVRNWHILEHHNGINI